MKKYPFESDPEIAETIAEELSLDPTLKRFFIDHDIQNHEIENHLNDLMVFKQEFPKCRKCEGLHVCSQDTLGFQPALSYQNERITLAYQPCNFMIHALKQAATKKRVDALYMPEMIYQATLADFWLNSEERKNLYQKIMTIVSHVKLQQETKGLYLHGEYRIGKTYVLAAIANQLAALHRSVILAYYPDLVREIKSSIRTGELENIIHKLKTVDVLMLDDIGGEAPSQWMRDEVLGPILQYRLLDHKLMFFSSNLPLTELASNMTESNDKKELAKAFRIATRIKELAEEFKLSTQVKK